jgi:hypothetical protein
MASAEVLPDWVGPMTSTECRDSVWIKGRRNRPA